MSLKGSILQKRTRDGQGLAAASPSLAMQAVLYCLTLEDVTHRLPETSVNNVLSKLRKIPEQRKISKCQMFLNKKKVV